MNISSGNIRKGFISAVVFAVSLTQFGATARADGGANFTVDFTNCTEFAGVGPVNFGRASALVPSAFSALPVGSTGGIVVRGTSCGGVSVNGGKATRTAISQGKAGYLYVQAEGLGVPAYFMAGTETDPTGPYPGGFNANWWYEGFQGSVKQASNFPNIGFGTASVAFFTDDTSVLGKLIGGNSDSNFSFLPLRGVYASAHMVVTVTKK